MDANVGRGSERKHPLTYKEIWDLIKAETEELGLSSSSMMSGDAYTGVKNKKSNAKESNTGMAKSDFEKVVKELRANLEGGRGGGRGGRGRGGRPANTRGRGGKARGKSDYGSTAPSAEARAKETCDSYNAGVCSLSSCKKGVHK